ncbi:MAG: FmdB family zinc ribbon protein [Vicinamibacteria bacterium]
MPLYEYECVNDGRFELIRKFSDPPVEACPTCGQPVEKLLSSPAIQFKGSGWYVTDYARKGGDPKAADAKKADAKSGDSKGGDAQGGDSKAPESKASDSKGGESKAGSSDSGSRSGSAATTPAGSGSTSPTKSS